jgi:hypothetical protein
VIVAASHLLQGIVVAEGAIQHDIGHHQGCPEPLLDRLEERQDEAQVGRARYIGLGAILASFGATGGADSTATAGGAASGRSTWPMRRGWELRYPVDLSPIHRPIVKTLKRSVTASFSCPARATKHRYSTGHRQQRHHAPLPLSNHCGAHFWR